MSNLTEINSYAVGFPVNRLYGDISECAVHDLGRLRPGVRHQAAQLSRHPDAIGHVLEVAEHGGVDAVVAKNDPVARVLKIAVFDFIYACAAKIERAGGV